MPQRRFSFDRSRRLHLAEEFSAVYGAKVSERRGPLVVYALPNGRSGSRLGLSTSRKVGTAARRNRIRRMIREAFRGLQPDFPGTYDLLIVVRPHEPAPLAEYRRLLTEAVSALHQRWRRRIS